MRARNGKRESPVGEYAALGIGTGIFIQGIAAHASSVIVDDAFITLRYAERLVAGHGLTWTDGERVEGYSNLLWLLLTAALGALGVDWVLATRILGVGCTAATFAVIACSVLRGRGWPALGVVVVIAALLSTPVWAMSGLETPLALLLVALALRGLQRVERDPRAVPTGPVFQLGLPLALLAWTRPEAPILIAAFAAGAAACGAKRAGGRAALAAAVGVLALPALAIGLQLSFRLAYYGDWVPNVAHVKVAVSAATWQAGWIYLQSAALAWRGLLVPAALALVVIVARRRTSPLAIASVSGVALVATFVVAIGGDHFPCNRLFVPLLPLLAVVLAIGLEVVAARSPTGRWLGFGVVVAGVAVARLDARPSPDPLQQPTTWPWAGEAAGRWLREGSRSSRQRSGPPEPHPHDDPCPAHPRQPTARTRGIRAFLPEAPPQPRRRPHGDLLTAA